MLMLSWRFITASISTLRITSSGKWLRIAELKQTSVHGPCVPQTPGQDRVLFSKKGGEQQYVEAEVALHHSIDFPVCTPTAPKVVRHGRTGAVRRLWASHRHLGMQIRSSSKKTRTPTIVK